MRAIRVITQGGELGAWCRRIDGKVFIPANQGPECGTTAAELPGDIPPAKRWMIEQGITAYFMPDEDDADIDLMTWYVYVHRIGNAGITGIAIGDGKEQAIHVLSDVTLTIPDGPDNVILHYASEQELLAGFAWMVHELLPDLVVCLQPDLDGLLKRCQELDVEIDMSACCVLGIEEMVDFAPVIIFFPISDDVPDIIADCKRMLGILTDTDQRTKTSEYNWRLKELSGMPDLSDIHSSDAVIDMLMLRQCYGVVPLPKKPIGKPRDDIRARAIARLLPAFIIEGRDSQLLPYLREIVNNMEDSLRDTATPM